MEILVHFDRHARQHFVGRSPARWKPRTSVRGSGPFRPAEVATTHTEALALVLRLPKAAIAASAGHSPHSPSPRPPRSFRRQQRVKAMMRAGADHRHARGRKDTYGFSTCVYVKIRT